MQTWKLQILRYLFFYKNTIVFAEPQYSFFSDLSLNIFLKYSCFRRSALLLTVSEKFHTRKSCISSKIKHTWNKAKDIFARKQENDTAELDEIIFYNKNVLVRMGTYKLTDKVFPRYKKLNLSYILKLFLNFSKFEPQYAYKLYILITKCV